MTMWLMFLQKLLTNLVVFGGDRVIWSTTAFFDPVIRIAGFHRKCYALDSTYNNYYTFALVPSK